MGSESATAQQPLAPERGSRAAIASVAARIVLLLAWLMVVTNAVTEAREVTLGDLERDLAEGRVTAIEVERAEPGDSIQGSFGLRWQAGLIDSFARYEYDPSVGVDDAGPLLDRARAAGVPVQVVSLSEYPVRDDVTREGWFAEMFGGWFGIVGLLAIAAGLVTLISGRQPWLATKWAWFWLVWAIPVLWVAFLALEPRPLRLSLRLASAGRAAQPLFSDRDCRLTGGWAFVIAWVASAILAATGLDILSTWR